MDWSAGSWTAGQVARHLGIAESTLRSWHRRYGVTPQGSEPGRYRRYSEADVARLRRMLDLIKLGMLASEAARTVQAGETEGVPADRDVADLMAAARAGDSERCRIVLGNVLVRRGVVEAWEAVCRPALVQADADQRDDPDCIDIEHALSWTMLGALHRLPVSPIAPGTPLILLACVEAEHHTLPLAALAAALGTHRIPVRMLGAATPTQSLVRAVRDTAPSAVVLWSQRPDTAGPSILQQLSSYPVGVFTAGPGWLDANGAGPPPGSGAVQHLAGLPDALAALVRPPFTDPDPGMDPGAAPDSAPAPDAAPARVPGHPAASHPQPNGSRPTQQSHPEPEHQKPHDPRELLRRPPFPCGVPRSLQ